MRSLNYKKINIYRDWKITISIFSTLLAVISIFAWQVYLSDKIGGGYFKTELTPEDIVVKTINIKELQEDVLYLESKEDKFLQIKNSQSKMVDPSL